MWPFKKKYKSNESIVKNIYKKFRIKRYISLILGLLLISIAFNLFLLPNNIVFGGVSGLSIITKKVLGWQPSTFILASSLLLLLISYAVLGKEKTIGSVLGSILFPIFVNLTANIPDFIKIDNSELLLSAVFGGILYGLGAGLVFKAGFTTGGTDIINQIISKYRKVSMGNAMLMSDGLIVFCGVFVFGITKLMYALIVVYIIGLLTDRVLLGISDSKAFYIIANKDEEIKDYVLNYLNHGVTIFDARGGYSKEKEKVLMCVVPTKEYFKLKAGIHEIDKSAFFVVTDAYEVFGGE
ncbi:MAG: YitT family protein [Bacilli bacterium]|nr:YitT family protein [Bacilli bacterium]